VRHTKANWVDLRKFLEVVMRTTGGSRHTRPESKLLPPLKSSPPCVGDPSLSTATDEVPLSLHSAVPAFPSVYNFSTTHLPQPQFDGAPFRETPLSTDIGTPPVALSYTPPTNRRQLERKRRQGLSSRCRRRRGPSRPRRRRSRWRIRYVLLLHQ
jgi:hypothetical protein